MDLIFKGFQDEIEKFVNEIIYPVIKQRQHETEGHYFRFTADPGEYQSRKKDNIFTRRIRGYFPGLYYKVDFYADQYKEKGGYQMTLFEIRELGDELAMLKSNLFAVKAAIFHGELEGESADEALAVIIKNMGEIADKIQNASMTDETIE